ncbi:MAG TPA: EAL domain-containing protein [Jatrophihabitans sp.]|nr:EAL domain-containing protein [Jatrophihabitans sp.]
MEQPARGAPLSAVSSVEEMLDGLEIVLQPIVEVATGALAAVEALARFRCSPTGGAGDVFAHAHASGFGYELEAECVRRALDRRAELPSGTLLTLNMSPDVLGHDALAQMWDEDLVGVVVEVTEHASSDVCALQDNLGRLRGRGALIAVDDVGTGYAGLLRLATMRPDYVKIDRAIVAGVRHNPAQRAVLDALVTLSQRMGALTIGEGVETLDDLAALAEFDVDLGQGWAVGRPARELAPIDPAVRFACRQARGSALRREEAGSASADAVREVHAVTLALASATRAADLRAAIARAASDMTVDVLAVSALGGDGVLREIAVAGADLDTTEYPLSDFPATRRVLQDAVPVEAHLSDPNTDPAEKGFMRNLGFASLLIVPLYHDGRPIGILEFAQFTHRRWTGRDIAHARGLATHLSQALPRIAPELFVLSAAQGRRRQRRKAAASASQSAAVSVRFG